MGFNSAFKVLMALPRLRKFGLCFRNGFCKF